ncbi:hypothetical protein [Dysgonomonas sp. 520]|uniref:hypothetical protein n=1 Tax=Dysgonomonas sp. 520 TaxID=2302931 RepID=UPI0013D529BB|nr:hypothetical protein [Dysgonomonas sp. 520]NDW10688.1 hypothetical protein [Dysgonomonas sp. 520]
MMGKENDEEKRMIKIILDAYNSKEELKNRKGAQEYIDSLLDRLNELENEEENDEKDPSE